MTIIDQEEWKRIPSFPDYEISSLGNIYNSREHKMMRMSQTTFGHAKISLVDYIGRRYTRSVAKLVAEAFVEPPNILCDHVILLDGDKMNVAAYNLAWRPVWFGWKYVRQLKTQQPRPYLNLRVRNCDTGVEYRNIVEAGMTEGLLFEDIWKSTNSGERLFPNGYSFEIVQRV